jgi:hypothetical protein
MSSTNDEWFIVNNLDDFINATRALVFNNFGQQQVDEEMDPINLSVHPDDVNEIDSILSFDESKLITLDRLKKQKNKQTKKVRYMLNDSLYMEIISALNDRMVSNILNGLVSKGLVESAYDSDANDFIFWVKKENEKPETD